MAGAAEAWAVESGPRAPRRRFIGLHESRVIGLDMSEDGRLIATGAEGDDGAVRLWSVHDSRLLARWPDAHPRPGARTPSSVYCVRLAVGGARVVSGGEDTLVRVRDAAGGRELQAMKCDGAVLALALSQDGETVVAGDSADAVSVWGAQEGRQTAALAGHAAPVTSVALSPDGRTAASGSEDGTARLWDVGQRRERLRLEPGGGPIAAVAFAAGGELLVTGGQDGSLRSWQAATGAPLGSIDTGTRVAALALSADGALAASGGEEPVMRLWDRASGLPLRALACTPLPRVALAALAATPDGRALAAAADSRLELYYL